MDKKKILRNFPSKNFWITNAAGWGVAAIANIVSQYLGNNFNVTRALLGIIPMVFAFGFTSALRIYWGNKNIYEYKPHKLILVLIPHSIITTALIVLFGIGTILLFNNFTGNIFKLLLSNFLSLFSIVLLWISVYFVVVYYTSLRKKEIDNLKLQNSLQSAHLTNLKNQLNPHFLFNALNNIRSLIREDAEKSRKMITSLTDILRYSLSSANQQKVLLKNEIEFISEYLQLEHLHMEDRLSYEIKVDEKLENVLIPPMIIQLLVENSIKHGISKSVDSGSLNVDVSSVDSKLFISVTNTGKLTSDELPKDSCVGLTNLTERLRLLYGSNSQFEITNKNNLVVATILLPLEYMNESFNS